MRGFRVVVETLSLILVTTGVSAEAFLRVQVVDQKGDAVHNAEVSVALPKAKRGKTDKTDLNGFAEFKKLKEGYYRVWARADGFKPGLFEFLRVNGESEKSIRLELEQGSSGGGLYFESPSLVAASKQLVREGLAAMNAQEFAQAEDKLKEALSICPSDPYTHKNLSIVYVNSGKWEPAEESLNVASDLVQVLGVLGEIERAEVEEQEAELDQLRRQIPVRRLAAEADEALNQQDMAAGISKLQELVSLEPRNAEYHYHLANVLARDGKNGEAIKAIDSALELEPGESRYLRFKSSIVELVDKRAGERGQELVEEIRRLLKAHDYEAVLARCQTATAAMSDAFQPFLWLQMARARVGIGQADEAVAAYEKSIALAPDNVDTRRELTGYLIDLGRYDEAFNLLREMSERTASAYDEALFLLAGELVRTGKQTQARVAFERVLEVNPNYAQAYYELGVEYYYGGQDTGRAKVMLQKYVEIGEDPELLENAKTLLRVIK